MRALLRYRLGCHSLLKDVGCRKHSPGPHRFCNVCHLEQPGDDYHFVCQCQALQGVRDKHSDLFGEQAGKRLKFMWQANLHGTAILVMQCLEEEANADPEVGQPSDQP